MCVQKKKRGNRGGGGVAAASSLSVCLSALSTGSGAGGLFACMKPVTPRNDMFYLLGFARAAQTPPPLKSRPGRARACSWRVRAAVGAARVVMAVASSVGRTAAAEATHVTRTAFGVAVRAASMISTTTKWAAKAGVEVVSKMMPCPVFFFFFFNTPFLSFFRFCGRDHIDPSASFVQCFAIYPPLPPPPTPGCSGACSKSFNRPSPLPALVVQAPTLFLLDEGKPHCRLTGSAGGSPCVKGRVGDRRAPTRLGNG